MRPSSSWRRAMRPPTCTSVGRWSSTRCRGVAAPLSRTCAGCSRSASRLLPRFRRRLSMPNVGTLSWPTWVADQEFEIDAQVPHATLPEPGGRRELLEWFASFYSRRLDRTLPLWEMALLDGLSDVR